MATHKSDKLYHDSGECVANTICERGNRLTRLNNKYASNNVQKHVEKRYDDVNGNHKFQSKSSQASRYAKIICL